MPFTNVTYEVGNVETSTVTPGDEVVSTTYTDGDTPVDDRPGFLIDEDSSYIVDQDGGRIIISTGSGTTETIGDSTPATTYTTGDMV